MQRFLPGLLVLAVSVAAVQAQPLLDGEPVVRVRILSASPTDRVTVTSTAPIEINGSGASVGSPARLEMRVRNGRVEAKGRDVRDSAPRFELRSEAPIQIRSGRTSRSYAGDLIVSVEGRRLRIVNHVGMTDYVASVVASEYPFTEIEGIKAQAILARTYAARRASPARSHDLDDHEGAQVYKGLDVVTDRSYQAASETRGERLYYGTDLAEAVYSSSSGGHTADNETIWEGAPVPYLRGVSDPYDADAPHHAWTTSASRRQVHKALGDRFGGRVRGVSILSRSPEGRVLRLRLDGSREISGSQFRATVNAALGYRTVRSTLFTLDTRGGDYVLEGRGFGHGVGMSQYGARAQAREGWSYREILAYYFQGTVVEGSLDTDLPRVVTRRWPTPRTEAGNATAGTTDTPRTTRTRPTPRREARATRTAPRRRAW